MGIRDWVDALLGRTSRKLTELKNLLGLTVSRVALLRIQRHSRFAQAQADVFHLLLLGNQDRALLRAELVIKEQNMIEVLNMVEGYCHLLTERAFLLHNQKECPEELREAAAGLVFAASRCGELPELRDVRRFFAARFGKEFTTAAAELRNHCGVSGKMVQKFSTRQPSLEIRAKVIKEITFQRGIKVGLTESIPETAELYNEPKLPKDDSQTTMEPPAAACDLQDFLVDEKLIAMAREKCKDAESAAQAAFESAAFAAIAARTAAEFYRSETQRRNSVDSSSLKRSSPRPEYAHSNSCCSSVDLGCRVSRVSALQIEPDQNPKSKEILSDESDCEDELVRLASKPLGTMTRARSFAGLREHDFKFNNQLFGSRDADVNESDDRMAIVAVEGNSVNSSSSSPNRISVRTRKMTC